MFVLRKKTLIITFTSIVTFQLFFFFLLSNILHLLLADSDDCFTIMFCLSKKKILIITFTSMRSSGFFWSNKRLIIDPEPWNSELRTNSCVCYVLISHNKELSILKDT